jgi:hypothetical protein
MTRWIAALATLSAAAAVVVAGSAQARGLAQIHGKVAGSFASASSCFGCGDMVKYIKADRVWCAWQGDNVIIHVRFRNTSIARVTVTWHPSYEVRSGGSHGEGFSSLQEQGLNARAARGVFVKQQPKGVPAGSPLASCKPSFFSVKSG